MLDPNRNVDLIFRQSLVTLKDGDLFSGLFRRDEGLQRIFLDGGGQERRIARADIRETRETENSLMPDNFAEVLPVDDFNHLLAFLLTQREKPAR